MPLTVSMPNRIAVPVTLASQQATVAARAATLEQLRERLESGEPPEKKVSRMTEEEQRLVQQALQRNLFSMARQIPMKIKINGKGEQHRGIHSNILLGFKPAAAGFILFLLMHNPAVSESSLASESSASELIKPT